MKSIAIFTTTRAEFGLLYPLIDALAKQSAIRPYVFVGGAHMAPEFGRTITEIRALGVEIDATFDFYLNGDDASTLVRSTGVMAFEVDRIFSTYDFEAVCLLGDRFELLPIVQAAILYKRGIVHIHGGEATEGLIDEQIRHMVTKAAHCHFVACQAYAVNVGCMGEPADRIHVTGALGIDNIVRAARIGRGELFAALGLDAARPAVLLTYHPTTLEFGVSPTEQIVNVFSALEPFGFQIVVTAPNAEVDREAILAVIRDRVDANADIHLVDSLGHLRYHSMAAESLFVIGNSSSGIIEVPFFRLPSVNIGDRQRGRLRHPSIIDTDYSVAGIRAGIERALDQEFRRSLVGMPFEFGTGGAAELMVNVLQGLTVDQAFLRKRLVVYDGSVPRSV